MKSQQILKTVFFAWPIVEIAGFIIVGKWLGLLATLLLVIALIFLGTFILRYQGLIQLYQLQTRLKSGESLAPQVLDNALLMLAGFLLLLPGFIKDIPALILLLPAARRWLIQLAKAKGWIHLPPENQNRVIEAEYWREDSDKDDRNN